MDQYYKLHAAKSILKDAIDHILRARYKTWENQFKFPQFWWTTIKFLEAKVKEVEDEISRL